jgi:hypothetical protein
MINSIIPALTSEEFILILKNDEIKDFVITRFEFVTTIYFYYKSSESNQVYMMSKEYDIFKDFISQYMRYWDLEKLKKMINNDLIFELSRYKKLREFL